MITTTKYAMSNIQRNNFLAKALLLLMLLGGTANGAWAYKSFYYWIVNNDGVKVCVGLSQTAGKPSLPQVLRNDMVQEYRYYSDEACTVDITDTEMTALAADEMRNIFVRYTLKDNLPIKFDRSKRYRIYTLAEDGTTKRYMSKDKATDYWLRSYVQSTIDANASFTSDAYAWEFGGDPYGFRLYNAATGEHMVNRGNNEMALSTEETSTWQHQFALIQGQTDVYKGKSGTYAIIYTGVSWTQAEYKETAIDDKSSSNTAEDSYRYNAMGGNHKDSDGKWEDILSKSNFQLYIEEAPATYTYHLINRSGGEVFSYAVETPNPASTVGLRDDLISPYATNFHYYDSSAKAQANTATSDFTDYSSVTGYDIYVGYDVDNEALTAAGLALDKSKLYTIAVGNEATDEALTYLVGGTSNFRANNTLNATSFWALWKFEAPLNDPYNITIRNHYYESDGSDYNLTSQSTTLQGSDPKGQWFRLRPDSEANSVKTFALLGGNRLTTLVTENSIPTFGGLSSGGWLVWYAFASENVTSKLSTLTIKERKPPVYIYYRIINNSMQQAMADLRTEYAPGTALALPTAYQSPLVKSGSYTYYTSDAYNASTGEYDFSDAYKIDTQAEYDAIAENDIIYVRYEYDPANAEGIHLDGSTIYAIQESGSRYVYASKTVTWGYYDVGYLEKEKTPPTTDNDNYYWKFTGEDPYNITITNTAIPDHPLAVSEIRETVGADVKARIWEDGADHGTPQRWLYLNNGRLVTIQDSYGYHFRFLNGNVIYLRSETASNIGDGAKVTFSTPTEKTYTFHIVDRAGHKAIKATGKWPIGVTLNYNAIPEEIRSPFLLGEKLRFYTTATANASLTSAQTSDARTVYDLSDEITEKAVTADMTDIYVSYDYTPEKHVIDLSGETMSYYLRDYKERYATLMKPNDSGQYDGNAPQCLTEAEMQFYSDARQAGWRLTGSDPYNTRITVGLTEQDEPRRLGADAGSTQWNNGRITSRKDADLKSTTYFAVIPMVASDYSCVRFLFAGDDTENRSFLCVFSKENNMMYAHDANGTYAAETGEHADFKLEAATRFHIINTAGKQSLRWRGPSVFNADGTLQLRLPEGVLTPLIPRSDFSLYATVSKSGDVYTPSGSAVTTADGRQADVYVTYSTDHLSASIDLSGQTPYTIVNPYIYQNNSYVASETGRYWYFKDTGWMMANASASDNDKTSLPYLWLLNGDDPYNIQITNMQNGYLLQNQNMGDFAMHCYSTATGASTAFALLGQYNKTEDDYRFMSCIPEDKESNSWYAYNWTAMCDNGNAVKSVTYYHQSASVIHLESTVKYTILNLSGKPTITYDQPDGVTIHTVPEQLQSPLAKNYRYYKASQFTDNGDGTYILPETQKADSIPYNSTAKGYIYVTYEYNAEAAAAMDIDLSGANPVTLQSKRTGHFFEFAYGNSTHNLRGRSNVTQKHWWQEWWLNGNDKFDPYEVTFSVYRYESRNSDNMTKLGATNQEDGRDGGNAKLIAWVPSYETQCPNTTWMILNKDADGYVNLMVNRYPSVANYQYLYEGSNADDALKTARTTGKQSGEDIKFKLQPVYTYHVVNLSGKEALSAIEGRLLTNDNHTPQIPLRVKSPFVKRYYFYDKTQLDFGTTISLKEGATELQDVRDATDRDIYALYRSGDIDNTLFDLTGQTIYNLYTEHQGRYVYDNGKNTVSNTGTATPPSDEEKESSNYLWYLKGGDPYNVGIYNMNASRATTPLGHVQSNTGNERDWGQDLAFVTPADNYVDYWCMVWGSSSERGQHQIQLLAASTTSPKQDWYFANTKNNGAQFCWSINTLAGKSSSADDGTVMNIVPNASANVAHTYILVNNKGEQALKMTVQSPDGTAPEVPVAMRSPHAENYRYYSDEDCTQTLETLSGTAPIYVRYDVKSSATTLDITGQTPYFLMADGRHTWADDSDGYKLKGRDMSNATDDELKTMAADAHYRWAFRAVDGDPYNVVLSLPGVSTSLALGTSSYTRPSGGRRAADVKHALQLLEETSENVMSFALINGDNAPVYTTDGTTRYALAATAHSGLTDADITGSNIDYIGYDATTGEVLLMKGTTSTVADTFRPVDEEAQVTNSVAPATARFHIFREADRVTAANEVLDYTVDLPDDYDGKQLPDAVRRGFCQYTYYPTKADMQAGTNGSTDLAQMNPKFHPEIWATYTVDAPFAFATSESDATDNGKWYSLMNVAANHLVAHGGGWTMSGGDTPDVDSDNLKWTLIGDPYDLRVINKGKTGYYLSSNGNNSEMKFANSASDDNRFAISPYTNDDYFRLYLYNTADQETKSYIVGATGGKLNMSNSSSLASSQYLQVGVPYKFHLLDTPDGELTAYQLAAGSSAAVKIPMVLRRGFCDYHYYTTSAKTTPVVTYADLGASKDVYATYTLSSSLPFKPTTDVNSDDTYWYFLSIDGRMTRWDGGHISPNTGNGADHLFAFKGDPYQLLIAVKSASGYLKSNGWIDNINSTESDRYFDIAPSDDGILRLRQKNKENYLQWSNNQAQTASWNGTGTMCDITLKQLPIFVLTPQQGGTVLTAFADDDTGYSGTIEGTMPELLMRKGCDYTYYADAALTQPISDYIQVVDDIYVTYTVSEALLGFKYSGTLDDLASLTDDDLQDANWNLWQHTNYTAKRYLFANDSEELELSDSYTTPPAGDAYLWAYYGDPYSTKIINKLKGKDAYLAVKKADVGDSMKDPVADIYLSTDHESYYTTWQYAVHTEDTKNWLNDYTGQFFLDGVTRNNQHYFIDTRVPSGSKGYHRVTSGVQDQSLKIIPVIPYWFHIVNQSNQQAMAVKTLYPKAESNLDNLYKDAVAFYASNAGSSQTRNYYDKSSLVDGTLALNGAPTPLTTYTPNNDEDEVHIYVRPTIGSNGQKDFYNGSKVVLISDQEKKNYLYLDDNGKLAIRNFAAGATEEERNEMKASFRYLWKMVSGTDADHYDPFGVVLYNFTNLEQPVTAAALNTKPLSIGSADEAQTFVMQEVASNMNRYSLVLTNSNEEGDKTFGFLSLYQQDTPVFHREAGVMPDNGKGILQFEDADLSFTYHVYNMQGKKAIGRILKGAAAVKTNKLLVPAEISSPLVDDDSWHFWKDKTLTTPLTSLEDAVGGNIYVSYDFIPVRSSIDLTGETMYNILHPSAEKYWASKTNVDYGHPCARDLDNSESITEDAYLWMLKGSDPYAIKIVPARTPDINLGSYLLQNKDITYTKILNSQLNIQEFILLPSSADATDYELVLATGERPAGNLANQLFACQPDGTTNNNIYAYYTEDTSDNKKYDAQKARLRIVSRSSDYAYHIINRSGKKALTYKGKGVQGKEAKELPRSIQSPLASEMRFYLESDVTMVETDGVKHYTEPDESKRQITFPEPAIDPDTKEVITPHLYAFYDIDNTQHPTINLSSRRYYYLKAGLGTDLRYIGTDGSEVLATTDKVKPTSTETSTYLWMLDANDDPYNLKLHTVSASTSMLGSDNYDEGQQEVNCLGSSETTVGTFCLLSGNGNDTEYYTLVAASADGITDNQYAYLGLEGGALKLLRGEEYTNSKAALQIQLETPRFDYTYRVVNNADHVAIQMTEEQATGQMPDLPAAIRSPFATPTGYYYESQYTVTGTDPDATYALKDKEQSLDADGSMGLPYYDATIYVEYKNSGKGGLDITGQKYYYLVVGDETTIDQATGLPASSKYQQVSGSTPQSESRPTTADDKDLWALVGGSLTEPDPYDLTLKNRNNASVFGTTRFIVTEDEAGNYLLLHATGTTSNTVATLKYLQPATATTATTAQRVQLLGVPVSVTYNVINLRDYLCTHNTVIAYGGDTPDLPKIIRSPLVDEAGTFHYWKDDGVTINNSSGDNYSKVTAKPTMEYSSTFGYDKATETVYVTYDYDNTKSSFDLSGRAKFNIINTRTNRVLRHSVESDPITESTALKTTPTYLWALKCFDQPDPYDMGLFMYNTGDTDGNPFLHCGYGDDREFANYTATTETADLRMMRWNTEGAIRFILVEGDTVNQYKFLVDGITRRKYNDKSIAKKDGKEYYWYLNLLNNNLHPNTELVNAEKQNFNFKLDPADMVDVVYHLTHKVTGQEQTYTQKDVPVKMAIELPEALKRNYCDYTYTSRYTEDGTPQADPVAVTRYPMVLQDDPEATENALIDIYVDYAVQTLPFKLIPTLHNTKAEIEALDFDEVFDLSSYEQRKAKNYLYFLVQNVDNTFNKGAQYFLQRDEATGHISYLSSRGANDYELHASRTLNANNWTYSHVAEYYRATDHDAFRDKSWLWAFAGDPYDLYLFNMEGVTHEDMDPVTETTTTTRNPRHAVTWQTQTRTSSTTTTEHAVRTPDYTDESDLTFRGTRWALGFPGGTDADQTFSLMAAEQDAEARFLPDGTSLSTPLYWQVTRSAIDGLNEALLMPRTATDVLDYNLQVLPYEPVKYEDVNLVIRRDDNIFAESDTKTTHTESDLVPQTTGLSELFYSAKTREFAEGDLISNNVESLPYDARRQFCDYTIYTNVYDTPGDYTVKAGPYRDDYGHIYTSISGADTTYVQKDDPTLTTNNWKEAYVYTGETAVPGVWPQNVYVKYEVTSDIFLRKHPTKEQVRQMVDNNDHVYFMDFTDNKTARGYKDAGQHAYFDDINVFDKDVLTELETVKDEDGNDVAKVTVVKDKNGNEVKTVNIKETSRKNTRHYYTTTNRMETTPEVLKWYFVGDPYAVQVYNVNGEWNDDGTTQANLCRFDPTESQYQYVVDCVHLRLPDKTIVDPREYLLFYETGLNASGMTTGEVVRNPNYNKPFYDDFMWEVVPSISGKSDEFALRFKRDNVQLNYRNVYYYLAHDGKKKTYKDGTSYAVNLSYEADNDRHLTGSYKGMHAANDASCVIRVTPPVKVYFSAYKEEAADGNHLSANLVVRDELSEYFGLGETLNEVPRHLQRKFVKYTDLTYQHDGSSAHTAASFPFKLEESSVYSPKTYKFSVDYQVNDATSDSFHLFTTPDEYADGKPQWLDVKVGGSKWLYFDKMNTEDTDHNIVSGYNAASGWTTGIKGLHWAFVGDPYDFQIVNRRRYEDGTAGTDAMWLAAVKESIQNYDNTANDSVVWYTRLQADTLMTHATSTYTASTAEVNTHWSLGLWRTGDANTYYLRTASLKKTEGDYLSASASGTNQTNNFWRLVNKDYTAGDGQKTAFVAVPYSLADRNGNTDRDKTMNGLHTSQQTSSIGTAVAKDNDRVGGTMVNNDCFDANVSVYKKGESTARASIAGVELRYGEVVASMPTTLKRWGCDYRCYLNYDPATGTGTEIREFRELVDPVNGYNNERDLLHALINAGKADITYVYTVTDEAALYFTTDNDAKLNEHTWVNPYYQWTYRGTGEPAWMPVEKFDGYTYNSDGHITGEIWHTEYEWQYPKAGSTITAYGWLNTHSNNEWAYANEMRQADDDRLKWCLVGDPYSFTLTNYAQYLINNNSAMTYKTESVNGQKPSVVQAANVNPQSWSLAVDAGGNAYLAAIDATGNAIGFASFDRFDSNNKTLDASLQYLKLTGSSRDTSDPTGNLLSTGGAKSFFLTGLLRYAALVQYHLVMAHQHSLDYEDRDQPDAIVTPEQKERIRTTVNEHLKEYLKYKAANTYYDADKDNGVKMGSETAVAEMLRSDGTLRDFVSYPLDDYSVSRVGIGTRPQVPWYMKRQFCDYTVYQRDVCSSLTLNGSLNYPVTINGVTYTGPMRAYKKDEAGNYLDQNDNVTTDPSKYVQLWMDDAHTQPAYEIAWVSVTDPQYWSEWTSSDEADRKYEYPAGSGLYKKKPRGYDRIVSQNGQPLLRFDSVQHYNRKVVADVTYKVKTGEFRFADRGRSTTAWYQMMTNNDHDGLMNFSYREGIGARLDRQHHYTNNYLWAPEGDPYGFVLRSRYATVNGTGWDDVVVSTKGALPKKGQSFTETPDVAGQIPMYQATYTSKANNDIDARFVDKRIVHFLAGATRADGTTVKTDGATNAIYEMFTGTVNEQSFVMHPVSAWMDVNDATFESYYLVHETEDYKTYLRRMTAADVQGNVDANWRLNSTAEQLWPYFERAGYVGGLQPVVGNRYANRLLKSTLESYVKDPKLPRQTSVLDEARRLVYSGKFFEVDNAGRVVTEGHQGADGDVLYTEARPTNRMRFVSDNLVNMQQGYYRIRAFSQQALSDDGNDLSALKKQGIVPNAIKGITGPRYISGYRFNSERVDNPAAPDAGGRWLHFVETVEDSTTIHTWKQLKEKIKAVNDAVSASSLSEEKKKALENRDIFDHRAMRGDIDILPVEYDPSSIFYFQPVSGDRFDRFTVATQGLQLQARPGNSQLTPGTIDPACGHTMLEVPAKLKSGYSNKFRLDDVGGTALTLRTLDKEAGSWDALVEQSIKTNYLCIDSLHRYRVTIHTQNEMKEIGDHSDEHGIDGVQDTKWLLQPVGMPGAEWPYQAPMPLRLEVQRGGTTATGATDNNFYASLYMPFDTRLNSTVDVAFTLLGEPNEVSKTLRMGSVSTINNMGNPQFVPASWPVIVRTANPKGGTKKEESDGTVTWTPRTLDDGTTGKWYTELYLPNSQPTVIADNGINPNLRGQYLEQQLTDGTADGSVMVFGLPYKDGKGGHKYDRTDSEYGRVGFYKNDNWWRDNTEDDQRSNLYVWHNRVYYVHGAGSPAPQVLGVVFDDEDEEDPNIQDELKPNVPWPCDVYDLQGRKVATDETPQTLLKSHPTLLKGVYIFGGRKVIVK